MKSWIKSFKELWSSAVKAKPARLSLTITRKTRSLKRALRAGPWMSPSDCQKVELQAASIMKELLENRQYRTTAQLLSQLPLNRLKLQKIFKGVRFDEAIVLAKVCFNYKDWASTLRILDWAYSRARTPRLKNKILLTAKSVSSQVRKKDGTFEAKLVTLQLSEAFTKKLRRSGPMRLSRVD